MPGCHTDNKRSDCENIAQVSGRGREECVVGVGAAKAHAADRHEQTHQGQEGPDQNQPELALAGQSLSVRVAVGGAVGLLEL